MPVEESRTWAPLSDLRDAGNPPGTGLDVPHPAHPELPDDEQAEMMISSKVP